MGEVPSPVVREMAMAIAMEKKPAPNTQRRRMMLGMFLLKNAYQRSLGFKAFLPMRKRARRGARQAKMFGWVMNVPIL